MTPYQQLVAEDLAANYSARDGSRFEAEMLQVLLQVHKREVERVEEINGEPWEAACRIAILEGLRYHGEGDDAEEAEKCKRLVKPRAASAPQEPGPAPPRRREPKRDRKRVTIMLSRPQAAILAASADEALRRGFVDGHKHRTLERALEAVREVMCPDAGPGGE